LLTDLATCLGQDGHDLVGPDAAQGPDGIQDLHLQLSGLAGAVSQIVIDSPGGFEWATEPDPLGAALAEFFPASSPGQGDLYINPQVRSDLGPSGSSLPLGGSTGSLIQLANGAQIALTINYQGQSAPDMASATVSNLVSATLPMPPVTAPAVVVATFQVTDFGQDGTGQPYETGWVHLVVTAPNGVSFDSGTFSQIVWELSDQAGLAWDSTSATLGHNHIYATVRPNTTNVADLYFPQARNEAPAAGSTAPTMLLRVALRNDGNVYATPLAGTDWNPTAMTEPIGAQPPPNPAPTTEAELRSDLSSTSPEYDTIDLPANTTIVVTQPLEITHSVNIVGNHATLLFQQGTTPAWPANASGAIYIDAPAYTNIQLELADFTIKFDSSAPLQWANPPGPGPAVYDPENNPAGIPHAVIDTGDSNTNLNMTLLTLSNMTISGPPAFDGSTFSSLQSQLVQQGNQASQYVGEQALDLIRTNADDQGTIANSTFQGGTIEVFGGPWKITGNTVLGSTGGTYSPGAFAVHAAHDLVLEGNQVTQSDLGGREFRLVVLAVSGFNDVVADNSFGGGAGQIGNELTFSAVSGQFEGINDPEVILAEGSYGVLFEGRPAAISGDGRLIVLPDVRAYAFAGSTGPGMVVSILAGVNEDGSPATSAAGEWFRVAQQVSLDSDNSIELLMQDPLPATPPGGYYVVEVTGGFVNNAFIDNSLNLTGKSSTGIVLTGQDYGSRIAGNDFVGGTNYDNVYTGAAIIVGAPISSAASGDGPFPLPQGWTALPDLGTIIEDNTIDDSLGGIIIGVQHTINYWVAQVYSSSETGRVFLTATVSANSFEYHASFLTGWASASAADGNDPTETTTPPTVTVGSGFSAEAPGPYGSPRFPWAVGNVDTVNGSDTPIFVDPIENVLTIQGNDVELIAADGTVTNVTGPTGQVYAGTVNGAAISPDLSPPAGDRQPYFPFNLDNLAVAATPPAPPPPPPPPPPVPAPAAPTSLAASVSGSNTIGLSWSASVGATSYVVERSPDASNWSVVAPAETMTDFLDSGLLYSTTYDYRVLAVSSAGTSGPSPVVSAATAAPPDSLAGQPLVLTLTKGSLFRGTVATFTDANAATSASAFIATIKWGDGRVSRGTVTGGDGAFTISGAHRYARAGVFTVRVSVTLSAADHAAASVTSAAQVRLPARHLSAARRRLAGHPRG
jgi:hypothetical protein